MNQIERESVILNSAWAMIDGMVNWSMFVRNDLVGQTTLLFQSRTHAKLFIILLTDFLSPIQPSKKNETAQDLESVPKEAGGMNLNFTFHLRQVCRDPQLGDDATDLSNKVEELASWFEKIITSRDVNLANIDILADIEVERYKYIKMCGNIAKHSLARLNRLISDLRKLLEQAGHEVSIREAHLATEPFFAWFFDDVFMFHSNRIVELLNDIRWRLFEYLQSEYQQSWYQKSRFQGDYGYHIPQSVNDPLAQAMYWDLMNRVRTKPNMSRFVADDAFRRPHWSEGLDQTDV